MPILRYSFKKIIFFFTIFSNTTFIMTALSQKRRYGHGREKTVKEKIYILISKKFFFEKNSHKKFFLYVYSVSALNVSHIFII